MENVYITRSTYNGIVKELDTDKIPKELLDANLFDKAKIEFLYNKQIQTILAYKYLSEHPNELAVYQKNISKNISSNFYLIKISSKPKFHFFSECESLNHRFENMIIPEDIRNKGDKIIEEFRDFLLSEFGKFSPKRYNELKDLIVTKINLKFGVTLSGNEISILDEDNSGLKSTKDYSLLELEQKIIQFADEYKNLCKKYPDIFPKFTLKAFLSKKPEEITFIPLDYFKTNRKDAFCEILKDFYEKVQLPTFECLKQYYMVYFNPELKFEGQLLEQLGLSPCVKCLERANK